MTDEVSWGIVGTGRIAGLFATGLKAASGGRLVAIASRSAEKAEAFGREFNVSKRYSNYASLVGDPEVDVVYVATPHSCHRENSLLALNAGKAVLCEKPFAINTSEAQEVVSVARKKKLFLMEAMWTRCFPLMAELRRLLKAGAVGDVRMLTADFGFRADVVEDGRLFQPRYGGGALLDVGIYPISLASDLLGQPTVVDATSHLGQSGVDEETAVISRHGEGRITLLSCAIRTETPQEAAIFGTEGSIRIHSPWWKPTAMTISKPDIKPELIEFPLDGNGYNYEATEVMRCLREKKLESDLMSLDETLTIMRTLDEVRSKIGLKYPMEKS